MPSFSILACSDMILCSLGSTSSAASTGTHLPFQGLLCRSQYCPVASKGRTDPKPFRLDTRQYTPISGILFYAIIYLTGRGGPAALRLHLPDRRPAHRHGSIWLAPSEVTRY